MTLYLHPYPDDLWEPHKHPGPVECFKHKAKVQIRDGVKWITYHDDHGRGRRKKPVIVEMPENAPTKSCHESRHHQCDHRRRAHFQDGAWLSHRPMFIWRCGCLCHHHPERIGMLF
jgi:hypothetical protein